MRKKWDREKKNKLMNNFVWEKSVFWWNWSVNRLNCWEVYWKSVSILQFLQGGRDKVKVKQQTLSISLNGIPIIRRWVLNNKKHLTPTGGWHIIITFWTIPQINGYYSIIIQMITFLDKCNNVIYDDSHGWIILVFFLFCFVLIKSICDIVNGIP